MILGLRDFMTMDAVWVSLYAMALWLFDPFAWIASAAWLLVFRRRLGWVRAAIGSVLLGTLVGFTVMVLLTGLPQPRLGNTAIRVVIVLGDAVVRTAVLLALFALVRSLVRRLFPSK